MAWRIAGPAHSSFSNSETSGLSVADRELLSGMEAEIVGGDVVATDVKRKSSAS